MLKAATYASYACSMVHVCGDGREGDRRVC